MLQSIKGSVLLATFILLTIDFRGHERSMVEGGVVVEVVKQAEVNKEENAEEKDDDDGTYIRREVSWWTTSYKNNVARLPIQFESFYFYRRFLLIQWTKWVRTKKNDKVIVLIHGVLLINANYSLIFLGKYIGQYDPDCNEAIILTPTKKEADLEMDNKVLKHGGTTCHWTIIVSQTKSWKILLNK